MGLFGGIAGLLSGGSDTASNYGNITTPDVQSMQLALQQYVQQGILTPEDAQAVMQDPSAFSQITQDPKFKQAQMQALTGLQNVANQGGLTAIDKGQLNDIANQENTQARGAREAIMSNAAQRGVSGSGLELMNELKSAQGAASDQSNRDTSVAANAQQRALQALVDSGQMAGNMQGQDFNQQAQIVAAKDAISKFNAQNQQQTGMYNTQTANAAQAANLAAKQGIANQNTAQSNAQQEYNKNLYQNQFNNQLALAGGKSNAQRNDMNSTVGSINSIEGGVGNLLQGGYNALTDYQAQQKKKGTMAGNTNTGNIA